MDLFWHRNGNDFHLETNNFHVVGSVEKRHDGKYIAGVAIPYTNENGVEKDWEQHETPFDYLHEAVAWVEENARWTVFGQFLNFKNIKAAL